MLEQLAIKKPSAIHVKFEKNANYLLTLHRAAYYTAMMQLLGGDFVPDEDDRMYDARFYIPVTKGKDRHL